MCGLPERKRGLVGFKSTSTDVRFPKASTAPSESEHDRTDVADGDADDGDGADAACIKDRKKLITMKQQLTRAKNDGYRVIYIDETMFTRKTVPNTEWTLPK